MLNEPLRIHASFEDDESIARIGRGLCDRSLPKSEWTHTAHFAATLWLIEQRGAGRRRTTGPYPDVQTPPPAA